MIDSKGYRPNVGIILCNDEGRVFWAKRMGVNAWQFPQGGINANEDPEAAMYRELWEETGLQEQHVELLGRTRYSKKLNAFMYWSKTDLVYVAFNYARIECAF